MTEDDKKRLVRRAAIIKSLAHPSRLYIIELLEARPRCVSELTEAVGADITTISKHLSVMKRAGLVRVRKHGTFSEYELTCNCVNHMIDCIETDVEGRAEPTEPTCVRSASEKAQRRAF